MDKKMVSEVLDELRGNVELFYQQKTGEALRQFEGMLGKMLTVIDGFFACKQEQEDFPLDEEKLQSTLTEAMQALEERDMILLADIIQYDFIEYAEQLADQME